MSVRKGSQTVLMVTLVLAGIVLPWRILAANSTADRLDALKALIHDGKYAQAESGARTLLPEVVAVKGAESVEAANVLDVLVESLWSAGKAKDPDARQPADQAVAIKAKALGPAHRTPPRRASRILDQGHQHGPGVHEGFEIREVRRDRALRSLVDAAHERKRELVSDEIPSTEIGSSPVKRSLV